MKRIICFMLLSIIFLCLYAQYDEKTILLQQAQSMVQSRRFQQAETIYNDLMIKYPGDYSIVLNLINTLVLSTKYDEAYELLNAKKGSMPSDVYSTQKIYLLIQKSNFEEAYSFALNYLDQNPNQVTLYRTIASFFESKMQFEKAIQIYMKGRQVSHDETLNSQEMANDLFQIRNYKEAIPEYFKLLSRNPSYSYFVANQMQMILKDDPKQINAIARESEKSTVIETKEVYARSLVVLGNFQQALQIYRQLPPEKLVQFADEQYSAKRDSLALMAYNDVLPKIVDPARVADIQIRQARIFIMTGNTKFAENTLNQIINDKTIQSPSYRFVTRANREARELMAEVLIQQKGSSQKIIFYLNDAKKYAFNTAEADEIEFEIINYQIMNGSYDDAKQRLSSILKKENTGSAIYKNGYYYSFLIATMQNDPAADSLLNNCIIATPESPDTNDALYLSFIISGLKGASREQFLEAYRMRKMHQDLDAIAIMDSLYERTKDEELRILIGDWAIQSKQYITARNAFNFAFKDVTLKEYAALQITKLYESNQNEQQKLTIDFLKGNPDSVFSPEFRMLLSVPSESPPQ
jgi:hypothetical protein